MENSILLFRWYGVNRYQYALYDHPIFESYGGYPGGRGFPDKDEFENRRGRPDQE